MVLWLQEIKCKKYDDYISFFAFNLKELGQLQGQEGSNCIGG
jgi:hypothetical protein